MSDRLDDIPADIEIIKLVLLLQDQLFALTIRVIELESK